MRKIFPSYFSGAILGAIGYFLGNKFVTNFIQKGGVGNDVGGINFDEQALVIGFIGLLIGWLIGIGALKYPLSWLLALKDPDHDEEMRLAGKGDGAIRYFRFTTDHKVVGKIGRAHV